MSNPNGESWAGRPDEAPVDGPCQITPEALDALLGEVRAIDEALRAGAAFEEPGARGPGDSRTL